MPEEGIAWLETEATDVAPESTTVTAKLAP